MSNFQEDSIDKNMIAVTISHLLLKSVSAIISIVIARWLGVTELGHYAIAISFVNFMGIVTNIGLRDNLIKNISINKEKMDEYISTSFYLQFIYSILIYLIMALTANFIGYSPIIVKLIYIAGGATFLTDLLEFQFSYYYGIQKMGKIAFFRFIYTFSLIILISVLIYLDKGIVGIASANLTVAIFVNCFIFYKISRNIHFKVNKHLSVNILKDGIPFGLNSIFQIAYIRIGIVILSLLVSPTLMGYFDSSYKVMSMLFVIPSILLTTLYPVLFNLGANSGQKHEDLFRIALRYLVFICIPISAFIFVNSANIIVLIYGKSFVEAGNILKILSFLLAFQCISSPLSDVLTTRNMQNLRTKIVIVTFFIALVGNLLLINLMGVNGASLMYILIEFFLVVTFYYFVQKLIFDIKLFSIIGKPIFAALIMATTLYFLQLKYSNSLYLSFFCGAIIYLFSLFILKFSTEQDKSLFLAFIKKNIN